MRACRPKAPACARSALNCSCALHCGRAAASSAVKRSGSPVSQASGAALGRRPRTRQRTTRPCFLRCFACYYLIQTAVKIAMLVGARGPPSPGCRAVELSTVEANEAPSRRCRADCRGAVEALPVERPVELLVELLSSSCRAPVEADCMCAGVSSSCRTVEFLSSFSDEAVDFI